MLDTCSWQDQPLELKIKLDTTNSRQCNQVRCKLQLLPKQDKLRESITGQCPGHLFQPFFVILPLKIQKHNHRIERKKNINGRSVELQVASFMDPKHWKYFLVGYIAFKGSFVVYWEKPHLYQPSGYDKSTTNFK